jgi:hypothetical protein
LVLQLARTSGPFWDAVADVRARWDITAVNEIPPGSQGVYLPEACEEIGTIDPDDYSPRALEISAAYENWEAELFWLHESVIPQQFRIGNSGPDPLISQSFQHWARFLSACVLFDPPSEALVAFADAFPHGPDH